MFSDFGMPAQGGAAGQFQFRRRPAARFAQMRKALKIIN